MSERTVAKFKVMLSIRPLADSEVGITIDSTTAGGVTVVDTTILLFTFWQETPDVVRARLEHPASGTVALLQSTRALLQLMRAINLRLVR